MNAVQLPVRPETRWMHAVSRASVCIIAGQVVVSRYSSIDFPAIGGPAAGRLSQNARISFTFTLATGERGSAPLTCSQSLSNGGDQGPVSSSSNVLASCKSAVSKPSVNQP
jgi:hypothetical protein